MPRRKVGCLALLWRRLLTPYNQEHIMQDGSKYLALLSSTRQSNPFEPLNNRSTTLLRKGEEIFYSYGTHSEDTLLSEYGFVLGEDGNSDDSVDVTELVQKLFERLPAQEKDEKIQVLQNHQYWG
jgi:hypothetical protein